MKYDKANQHWVSDDYDIGYSFKEIATSNGKVGVLAINDSMGASGPGNANLYELNYSGNKWNVKLYKRIEDNDSRNSANVIKLGNQKLGFIVDNLDISGSAGYGSSVGLFYSVNEKYKGLGGCLTREFLGAEIKLVCELNIRTDMPENDGFYPIEFKYSLERDQISEFPPNKVPKGWSFEGGDTYSKSIGKRKGSVIVNFDVSKQAYVLPTNFVKALNATNSHSHDYQGLWDYFKK